jgi:hypothetical protein
MTETISGEVPLLNNITGEVEIKPIFESIINKYFINIYIDNE